MTTMLPTARVTVDDSAIEAVLRDTRTDVRPHFEQLAPEQREQLALDAWMIGLRAMANAHAQAQEARLADVSRTLLEDLDSTLTAYVKKSEDTIVQGLRRYFDPADGQVTERLRSFIDDQGALAKLLDRFVGPRNSVLAETLAKQVGEQSVLFKKLSPTDSEGVINALEKRIDEVLVANQRSLQQALDPLAENGAVARFLKQLSNDLASSNKTHAEQLAAALAALDANDEQSLLRKLVRETGEARESLLRAMNPADPASPIFAIRTAIAEGLAKQSLDQDAFLRQQRERQEQLEKEMREALSRLETRRQADDSSPRGGVDFEHAVAEFIGCVVRGAPITVEETGNTVGVRRGCKVGDFVLRYTSEHAFAGASVAIEAKHDASYTEHKALAELDDARANRCAQVGLFIMAASHAPPSFPRLKRCGQNVLVRWDEHDPRTDPWLEAALTIALFLVSRTKSVGSEGDLAALRDVEERIQAELKRIEKMEDSTQGIRRNCDNLEEELGKARKGFNLLLRKAKATLAALDIELVEEAAERACPLELPFCGPLGTAGGALQ
ncbi:MAG: hypothetical protein QM831_21380 [Kofleriaceae bacterium]